MSDDESPVDPEAIAKEASGDPSSGDQPPGSGAESPSPVSRLADGLLSTEPDDDPESVADSLSTGHAIVGLKKFLNGAVGVAADRGTPAIANFVQSGLHFYKTGSESETDDELTPVNEGGDDEDE